MSSSLAEFISWPRNDKRTALFDSSSVSRYSYVMRITVTLHKLPNFLKSVQKGFTDEKFASSNPISYVLSLNFYVLTPVLSLNWSSSSNPHVRPPTPRAPPEPLQRAGSLIKSRGIAVVHKTTSSYISAVSPSPSAFLTAFYAFSHRPPRSSLVSSLFSLLFGQV